MFQGSLFLLTILTLVHAWGGSWPPGGEGGKDSWDLMRHYRALKDGQDVIRENGLIHKIFNLIPQGAILRSLRSPNMDKRTQEDDQDIIMNNGLSQKIINLIPEGSILRSLRSLNKDKRTLEDDQDMIRNNGLSQNIINLIPEGAILRSLRRPNKDKRNSNNGWTSEPGDEEITISAIEALHNFMVIRQERC